MNKADLIEAISLSANLSKTTAGRALEAITSSITAALEKGDDVTLVGFGTFTIKKRTEREGRSSIPLLTQPCRNTMLWQVYGWRNGQVLVNES